MLEPLSFILQMEIEDIMHLLEVRKILEVETAALAALRATPEDLDDLHKALVGMTDELRKGEIGDAADASFHFTIARAANNPVLIKVMNTITDLMNTSFRSSRQKLFLIENMPAVLYNAHLEILEAILARNPNLARLKMREHLTMVEDAMRELRDGGIKSLRNFRDIPLEHKIRKDFGFPS